jgi:hypothetical protein
MKKKAQLEMMQTAFILLILFVLFTLALIFFIGYQKTSLRRKERDIQNLDIVKKSQILNFMPELQCSFDRIVYHDCYDLEKVKAFQERFRNEPRYKEFYGSMFGDLRITYARYVPEASSPRGWDPEALPPDDENFETSAKENVVVPFSDSKQKNLRRVQFPVSLYDPTTLRHHFGVIYLEIQQ